MRYKKLLVAASILFAVSLAICYATRLILAGSAAAHQRSVAAELTRWAQDHATIRDPNRAYRAVGMLEYIQNYYVVANGYRSDTETERLLEAQRDQTRNRICAALDEYVNSETGIAADHLRAAKSKALAGSRWQLD